MNMKYILKKLRVIFKQKKKKKENVKGKRKRDLINLKKKDK